MDFGLSELAIGDILYFIGEAIFGETAITTTTTQVTSFVESLLGNEGVEAIQNIIDMIVGDKLPSNVKNIDSLGGMELKKLDDIYIWEESPEINQVVDKTSFMDNVATIANQMKKNGISILEKDGFDALKRIVRRTIQLGSQGFKTSLDPKILIPSIVGSGVATKYFLNLQNKSDDIYQTDNDKIFERIKNKLAQENEESKLEEQGLEEDAEIIG